LSRRGRRRRVIPTSSTRCAYKTASGRGNWPNRDPIGEQGGFNPYAFVFNDPLRYADALGLFVTGCSSPNPCPKLLQRHRALCSQNIDLVRALREDWYMGRGAPTKEIRDDINKHRDVTIDEQNNVHNKLAALEDDLKENRCPFTPCTAVPLLPDGDLWSLTYDGLPGVM